MQIIQLPPQTVNFINAVYRSKKGVEVDLKEVLEGYRKFIALTNDWFETRKQIAISGDEPVMISNTQYLVTKREEDLGKLEASGYDTESFENYIKTEFELAESLTRLSAEREKQRVSPVPVANDFLIAAWAHINKGASLDVARGYMTLLKLYLENLEEDYGRISHALKPEVNEEFSLAFDVTKQAVKKIEETLKKEDSKELDTFCEQLKGGFNLLNYYLEWQKNQDEKLTQQYSRFKIPFIAHDLEILLSDAKEGRTGEWSDKVQLIQQAAMPELEAFWEQTHRQIFVKPSVKTEIVEKINDELGRLKTSLNSLAELTPEHLSTYEGSLENLSSLFQNLDQHTLRWNNLIGTGGELLGECVKGIYYGTLPDFSLRDITNYLRTSPLVSYFEDGIADLETYLEDFQKEHLLWGLEKLMATIPQKAEEAGGAAATLLCPYCGTSNLSAQSYCSKCNARLMFKGAMIMESDAPDSSAASINIMDLPLPSTAEPLVRLLHHVETGEYTAEEAEGLINNFISSLNQTASITKGDKLLSKEQQEKTGAILADFGTAAKEAQQFLESFDPDALRRALKKVSEASLRLTKYTEEEAERLAKQEHKAETR